MGNTANTTPPASLLNMTLTKPRRIRREPPEPQANAVAPERAAADAGRASGDIPRDLYTYWRRIASNSEADLDKLDRQVIGARWPYTLLLRGSPEAPLDIVDVFRPTSLAANDDGDPEAQRQAAEGHPLAEDLCSQVSSWGLALAREAVLSRQAIVAVERFDLARRDRFYRALALPCREQGSQLPHVLLYMHATKQAGP